MRAWATAGIWVIRMKHQNDQTLPKRKLKQVTTAPAELGALSLCPCTP